MNSRRTFLTTCVTSTTALLLMGALPKGDYLLGHRLYNTIKDWDKYPWYYVINVNSVARKSIDKYETIFIKDVSDDVHDATHAGRILCTMSKSIKCPTYKIFKEQLDCFEKAIFEYEKDKDEFYYRYIVKNSSMDVGFFASTKKYDDCY